MNAFSLIGTEFTQFCTLSLHDALPISRSIPTYTSSHSSAGGGSGLSSAKRTASSIVRSTRSEEHTSELQSLTNLVCRLLLEKKKEVQCRSAVQMFVQYCYASW